MAAKAAAMVVVAMAEVELVEAREVAAWGAVARVGATAEARVPARAVEMVAAARAAERVVASVAATAAATVALAALVAVVAAEHKEQNRQQTASCDQCSLD